jgi:hypothetical protein
MRRAPQQRMRQRPGQSEMHRSPRRDGPQEPARQMRLPRGAPGCPMQGACPMCRNAPAQRGGQPSRQPRIEGMGTRGREEPRTASDEEVIENWQLLADLGLVR